jgi:hypothetical protein
LKNQARETRLEIKLFGNYRAVDRAIALQNKERKELYIEHEKEDGNADGIRVGQKKQRIHITSCQRLSERIILADTCSARTIYHSMSVQL